MPVILGHHNNPHVLKCAPTSFKAIWSGRKRADFRRDDRGGFEAGQFLRLREWDSGAYTAQLLLVEITHVERGPIFGIPEGFAMLSICPISLEPNRTKWERKMAEAQ